MKLTYAMKTLFFFFSMVLVVCLCPNVFGQEENNIVATRGAKYVSLKVTSLEKYNSSIRRQQNKLLKKLCREEKKFARNLKKSDSAAFASYQDQNLSYDSILHLANADSSSTTNPFSNGRNSRVDSLIGVRSFIKSESSSLPSITKPATSNSDLAQLKGKLNYRNYINQLINERAENLKDFSDVNSAIPSLSGFEKQLYYGKSKMSVIKSISNEPTKAEEKALEYLQNIPGFEKAAYGAPGGMQSLVGIGNSTQALQNLGYQTNKQLQASLLQKNGSDLSGVTKKVSDNLSKLQDKTRPVTTSIEESKKAAKQLKKIEKPSFKINPMRGLPFGKRIEKQHSWQVARASIENSQPALLNMSASVGFKHTPKLMYGLGISGAAGLGQNWQNVHLSFEGIGVRSFCNWQLPYGISTYLEYERMFKQYAFTHSARKEGAENTASTHNTIGYSESMLIGISKKYHLNTKYNGAIQILYDVWWQQKGLNSPLVLRFVTIKK